MALGPENFSLDFLELYVDNTPVVDGDTVEVDPAISHSIRARYRIANEGASTFHWWECCMTVFDVTHVVAKGSRHENGQGWLSTTKDHSVNVGKITEPTEFRVRIWANQDQNAIAPPEGSW